MSWTYEERLGKERSGEGGSDRRRGDFEPPGEGGASFSISLLAPSEEGDGSAVAAPDTLRVRAGESGGLLGEVGLLGEAGCAELVPVLERLRFPIAPLGASLFSVSIARVG